MQTKRLYKSQPHNLYMEQRKVSKDIVQELRKLEEELLGAGLSVRAVHHQIGNAYGISRSTVRRYLVEGEISVR